MARAKRCPWPGDDPLYVAYHDEDWGVDGKPVVNRFRAMSEVPARTELSGRVSRDLSRRGFDFVGRTIVYAHLQATGVVNDHLVGCAFRRARRPRRA